MAECTCTPMITDEWVDIYQDTHHQEVWEWDPKCPIHGGWTE